MKGRNYFLFEISKIKSQNFKIWGIKIKIMDKRYKRSESVEDVIKAIVVAKAKLILEFLIKKKKKKLI